MLKNASRFVSPDVERLIKEVIAEDSKYEREMRSVHREKIVLPVKVRFMNGLPPIPAFSRNLSRAGACLITREPIEVELQALLQIYRLDQRCSEVVAECRWAKPFGSDYWMSGWQFLRLPNR